MSSIVNPEIEETYDEKQNSRNTLNNNLYIKGFYLIKIKISRSSIVKIDTMIVNINQYEIAKYKAVHLRFADPKKP